MNDIHSKEFKRKYLKCKYKLRRWEDKFFAENGRQPTRADIKTSDISVKEYYKQYWMLKTQILEDQILGEDKSLEIGINSDIPFNSDGVLKEQTNTLTSPKKVETSSKEEVKEDIEKNPSAKPKENVPQTETDQIDKDTWGAHLNKKETVSSVEKEKCTLLNNVVVGRLFEGSSFKKRNPRKALSMTKKKSNNKSFSENGNTSFDFQELSSLDFFSPEPNSQLDISQNQSLSSSQVLDETSFSVEDYCSPNVKALISSSVPFSPILSKSKDEDSSEKNFKQTIQPVSLIHAIASDPSVALKSVRSLNAGWVERCSKKEKPEERKSNCDSGFESMESSAPDLSDAVKDASHEYDSSDDDIIGASDNELDEKSRVSCTVVTSQKRKSDVCFLAEEGKASCGNGNPSEEKEAKHENKKIKIDPYEFVDRDIPKTKEEVKKSILERKMKSGTLNDNYVKINLKKKVFVRGKRNFNYARYKKQEWKNKKKNLPDDSKCDSLVQCYKCGETGHYSRNCKKPNEDKLLSADEESDDEALPTLEEAEKIAREKAKTAPIKKTSILNFEKPLVDKWSVTKVEPYYQLNENGSIKQTPEEVYRALEKFGHSEFRPGQEEAIMRILSGQSTLLTIATGGGKSLCYQLPAYLYANRSKCITLVVSPLVSLMEDQVAGSSSFFKVGCLHTSQTQKQRESVIQDAKNGKLYALLVSPEAVVSGETFNGFGHIFKQIPPIAFACIDEVHCISQWSHNFRPSYLMISKVLKEKLGVTVTLGLTATATISTINSIVKELEISETEGVIRDTPLPENLCLSISRDENKDEALLQLLKSPRFNEFNSILIYCTRRDECERLAVFLRTTLQEVGKHDQSKSKRLSWTAESYHAGMAASRRKQVQKAFMCGNLRIVVATIAFGMGINKQDIRGVIHYNMPKDFESYVQEVGRAGRDGLPAHCHLFLDSLGQDLNELRRHIYANSVDRHVLRKLLQRVFKSCNCKGDDESQKCEGHEVAFDCSETIQALDIPEENIYTLLCYLELHSKKFVKVMTPVYINCKVKSYKGVKGIHSAAKKCPPLAYACALNVNPKKEKSNILEFNVLEIANRLSWDSTIVKNELKRTEWELTEDSRWKKTGIAVEFSDLGFRVCSRGDLTPSELDQALEYLIQRVEDRDKRAFTQLDITFSTFDFFASDDYSCGGNGFDETKSEELKRAIRSYFEKEELFTGIPLVELQVNVFDEEALATDVRILLNSYRDNTFNGRAVARIFHGIQSPNYPASVWFRCKFWRKHIDKDFNKIIRIATREIIRLKP